MIIVEASASKAGVSLTQALQDVSANERARLAQKKMNPHEVGASQLLRPL
jgi:hypothetical protein